MLIVSITIFQQTRHELSSSSTRRKTKPEDEQEIKDKQAAVLTRIFAQTHSTAPHIVNGLIYFLRKVVARSDIVSGTKEGKLVKWGCGVAVNSLARLDNEAYE